MLNAREIMTREVVTLSPETGILDAARLLLEKGFNGFPVVDREGNLVGILCRSDLIAQQKKLPIPSVFTLLDSLIPLKSTKNMEKAVQRIAAITVGDAMTRDPITVGPESGIEEVAELMVDKNFHTLPVVDQEGSLVGVIGKEDVLKTLFQNQKDPE
ncbi:MAG: CBS domain-containing protein [Desulfobacteraceae bacterium]|nr:MAG: CBS domain-containing protein [Desulfobacteraceae bacterium]